MTVKASWGLALLLATGAIVGCGQSRTMVRGQSPNTHVTTEVGVESEGPIIGSAPGYAEHAKRPLGKPSHKDFKVYDGFRDNNFGYEGGYYAGPEGYYTDHDRTYMVGGGGGQAGGCPACEYGQHCPSDGCQHCGGKGHCGPGGFPRHYQTYRHKWPQNMVYPPDVQPAGMVQYPYYTLRGPTDFFMK